MTPEKAMSYAREDIAELRRAPTHRDCITLHAPIISYFRTLLSCGAINVAQHKTLVAEADAGLAGWLKPTDAHIQQSD
jgi:hypothetical protein